MMNNTLASLLGSFMGESSGCAATDAQALGYLTRPAPRLHNQRKRSAAWSVKERKLPPTVLWERWG